MVFMKIVNTLKFKYATKIKMYHNNALDDPELLKKFEESLKKSSTKQPLAIYSEVDVNKLRKPEFSAQSVIANVTTQLKAIEKADVPCPSNIRERRKKFETYKTSSFVPINTFKDGQAPQQKCMNNFDTQFVLDTQLINLIENVEAQSDIGITQEFETTFHNLLDDTNKISKETPRTSKESNQHLPDDHITSKSVDKVHACTDDQNNELCSAIDTDKNHSESNEKCTDILNNCIEIESHLNTLGKSVADVDIPSSYVFKPVRKSNTPSPLVFDLYKFEDFEKLAQPIIEEHNDLISAKHLINSQILGKEFAFETNDEPINADSNIPSSPVLKINGDNCKINDAINKVQSPIQVSKKNTFLKDEILFSSDEESDYIHKESRNLPLTSALEKSFYDHSEVLDMTMYVGFQTANNRSIQISRESFTKAKSFLKDLDSDNISKISLTDLVNKCDTLGYIHKISQTNEDNPSTSGRQTKKQINCKTKLSSDEFVVDGVSFGKVLNTVVNEENKDVDTINKDTKQLDTREYKKEIRSNIKPSNIVEDVESEFKLTTALVKRKYDGFMTASNKKIKLSDQAIAKSKQLFQDIDLDHNISADTDKSNINNELLITSPKKTNTFNSQQTDDIDVLNEFAQGMLHLGPVKNTVFVGLKPGKKDFHITEAPMTKTKKIFEDIGHDKDISDSNSVQEMSQLKPIKDIVIGFKTASKKNIHISETAMAKTKKIFKDVCDNQNLLNNKTAQDILQLKIINGTEIVDFKTASKKDIHISESSVAKTKKIFEDICGDKDLSDNNFARDMSQLEPVKDIVVVGFETASKKDIDISKTAMAKTKKIFDNIYSYKELSDNNFAQDTSQVKPTKDISEAAMAKTKQVSEDICDSISDNIIARQQFACSRFETDKIQMKENTEACYAIGFKTASNKSIRISEKALAKSKTIFEDLGDPVSAILHLTSSKDDPCPIATKSEDIEYNYQPTRQHIKSRELNKTESFIGFRTANNKDIKVSEEAYSKTKNMFKNITDEENEAAAIDDCTKVYNENPIADIQSNLEIEEINKLQSEMCDADFSTEFDIAPDNEPIVVACGFKTNNKPINISETKRLGENKKICADVDYNEDDNFNNINIKSSLDKSKSKSNIHKPNILQDPMLKMCGFKTASNKLLKISEKAIADSKKIFADLDFNDDVIVITDSDINFTKSNPSKAKEIISEKAVEKFSNTTKKPFVGFKTASNKEVKVSEEALTKSRHIFSDLTEYDNINYTKITKKKNEEYVQKQRQLPTLALFQTASQKPVIMSENALLKTRSLFEDFTVMDTQLDGGNAYDRELVPFKGFKKINTNINKITSQYYANIVDKENNDVNDNIDSNLNKEFKFIGFQTASKKPIQISEAPLAKNKLLFSDIDDTHDPKEKLEGFCTANNENVSISKDVVARSKKSLEIDDDNVKNCQNENGLNFVGFQTANNRQVQVSEEALKRSKQLLQDVGFDDNIAFIPKTPSFIENNSDKILISSKALEKSRKLLNDNFDGHKLASLANISIDVSKDTILEKLIDTQVVNNFDMTLCTEDFCADTTLKLSKRSGSPILSCPKPKKRKKFEVPYRSNSIVACEVSKTKERGIEQKHDSSLFSENYKKSKRYTLIDLADAEKNECKKGLDSYLTKFNYESLLNFEFSGKRNDLKDMPFTIKDIKLCFTTAVNKKLIPEGWLDNHIRLIIWKLISYEVRFPSTLEGVCSVRNVLDQLKFRYDKELYNAERPILRKILERDDVASKTMVLCVAGIYDDGVNVCSVTNISSNVELLLTDGWYCVKTTIDKTLTKLVHAEKIKIGCKLITNGAELLNCEQGVAPWEDTSAIRLKIFGNSTRLARWDTRLGCHSSGAMLTRLSTVQPEGGKVSKLRIYVTRVYPALFVEKFEDGSTVTRSERLEHMHQVKYEAEKQSALERIYEEVEKELSDQESQDSEGSVASKKICHDVSQYNTGSHITNSQLKFIEERSNRRREKLVQNIGAKIQEKMEKYGLTMKRNVVSLLKVRIAGVEENNGTVTVSKGLMSIWKPNDVITDIIKEGIWLEVLNVVPTALRYTEIQLSAGRHSVFYQSKHKLSEKILPFTKMLNRKCYHIKELTKNPLAHTDYNELDTVGYLFHIEPSISTYDVNKQPFQNIYLTDSEKNIICVNFWGGINKFGYQNVLDTGQVFACVNLQKRTGNTKKNIPHYRVTEFSYFTKTPKDVVARKYVDELVKIMSGLDKKKFSEECLVLKNNFTKMYNVNPVTPYRFNNDHNLTKNKMFIDSPVPQKSNDDLNLTGLDFESTFKQDTQLSPNLLLRKKKVNEKIARLKLYGEPPRLSPIHFINKSKSAFNEYKSPLISNAGVASEKNVPANSKKDIESSPVICLNRTYVKSMNPVKLNFNIQDCSSDNVDNFAEEFDGSPPLSLD